MLVAALALALAVLATRTSALGCASNPDLGALQCCTPSDNVRMANSAGQNPCQVIASVMQLCSPTFALEQLSQNLSCPLFTDASDTQASPCCCSTISYNLFAACRQCQTDDGEDVQTTYAEFLASCSAASSFAAFPPTIPHQGRLSRIAIPAFARQVPPNYNAVWNESAAFADPQAPNMAMASGAVPLSTASSATAGAASSTSSPTPAASTARTVAIAAAVASAAAVVLALVLVAVCLFRRRRRRVSSATERMPVPASAAPSGKDTSSLLDLTEQLDRPAWREPYDPVVPWARSPVLPHFASPQAQPPPPPRRKTTLLGLPRRVLSSASSNATVDPRGSALAPSAQYLRTLGLGTRPLEAAPLRALWRQEQRRGKAQARQPELDLGLGQG